MSGEVVVLVRIGLYVLAGYLTAAGLPAPVVDFLTTDPGVAELAAQIVAGVIAAVVYLWSRLAKRLGWAT